jgi:ankyrin repeat protein
VRISPEADGRADLQQPVTDIPTEFTEACQRGNIEKVRDFLDRGVVNANTDEGFPLTNACEAGHLNIVKLLCERGADPNVKDGLPLCEARLEGHTEIVNYLQERMEATRTTNTTAVSTNETNASAAVSDSGAAGSPAESQDEIRRRRLAALTGNATSQS